MLKSTERTLIIGSNGTIGSALADHVSDRTHLFTLSRDNTDYSDSSLAMHSAQLSQEGMFRYVICCIGALHNERIMPEKSLKQLSRDTLQEYFLINSILPALCLKHFSSLLDKDKSSTFIVLSAMVGSISDNKLGGWYGYRSSKAALNMLVKTASIEVARSNKMAALAVVHPGTTQGALSKPFSSGVSKDKYYSAAESAARIWSLIHSIEAEQSGQFFNWDGTTLAW